MKHIKLFEQFVESVSESKKFSNAFAVLDFFGGTLPNDYSKALKAARKAGHDLPTSLYYEAAELAQDGVNESVNEGVNERRDGFYSPSDIKKLRKFAEQISDEIIDTYEDDKNIDADDYTPEEMFNYISAWGADNQMKAANLIKEFNWELLTQELGLE